eukprot:3440852-Pyramimonas_sp.AAC.1
MPALPTELQHVASDQRARDRALQVRGELVKGSLSNFSCRGQPELILDNVLHLLVVVQLWHWLRVVLV